ncbi:MAG: hypothetical protein WAL66_01580 [Nitrososphaeraceae archaeon]
MYTDKTGSTSHSIMDKTSWLINVTSVTPYIYDIGLFASMNTGTNGSTICIDTTCG